nr:uncharacterized protein, mitochondrial [Quercus suber]
MLQGFNTHFTGWSRRHVRKLFAAANPKLPAQSPITVPDQRGCARKSERLKKIDATDATALGSCEKSELKATSIKTTVKCRTSPDAAPANAAGVGQTSIPPRLLCPRSVNHHDLPSFLAYASRVGLDARSTTYKGTFYEYVVDQSLSRFNFKLQRTGRSNDLGIDLVGQWTLPKQLATEPALRVLVQCKAVKPTPSMVRELEGAYVGAPAGWRGDGVLALLVASKEATKGVRAALQRSRWPMGILQVTVEGEVKQFLWNAVAAQAGLEGLGVTVRYGAAESRAAGAGLHDDEARVPSGGVPSNKASGSIALTWLGRPLEMGRHEMDAREAYRQASS